MNIGEKINQLRVARKITLMELAEKSGVAQATLSRIENGRMTGTVESHGRIAEALGVTLPELYADINILEKEIVLQKADDTANTLMHGEGGRGVILTKNVLRKKIMPALLEIQPGSATPLEQNSADTEKFIYCLEGKVDLMLSEAALYHLETGDSIYFNASLKHSLANKTDAPAKCLIVSSPPAL
jgi:transcriptional regulator with XRE-family HTH domain